MAETDLDEPRDDPKPTVDPLPDSAVCEKKPKRTRKPRKVKANVEG